METVTFMQKEMHLNKKMLDVGDAVVDAGSLRAKDLSTVKLPVEGIYVLSLVPSLDTGVCTIQTQTLSEKIEVPLFTVSLDLPFAQERWCGDAQLANGTILSDYATKEFLTENGLLIQELALAARAVFVIENGIVKARFVKEEMTKQVDFDEIAAATK